VISSSGADIAPGSSRGATWWAGKIRQFRSHLRARVDPVERERLGSWLTPAQLALFDAMHRADRRHGLDVAAALRAGGADDRDLLVAGLLHDCGKADTGVGPRVAFALGQAYGRWIWRAARILPGYAAAIDRLRGHAEASARMAASAGCSPRSVDLIRFQDEPRDPILGELLRLADEAN
jgi:hypothetical protein